MIANDTRQPAQELPAGPTVSTSAARTSSADSLSTAEAGSTKEVALERLSVASIDAKDRLDDGTLTARSQKPLTVLAGGGTGGETANVPQRSLNRGETDKERQLSDRSNLDLLEKTSAAEPGRDASSAKEVLRRTAQSLGERSGAAPSKPEPNLGARLDSTEFSNAQKDTGKGGVSSRGAIAEAGGAGLDATQRRFAGGAGARGSANAPKLEAQRSAANGNQPVLDNYGLAAGRVESSTVNKPSAAPAALSLEFREGAADTKNVGAQSSLPGLITASRPATDQPQAVNQNAYYSYQTGQTPAGAQSAPVRLRYKQVDTPARARFGLIAQSDVEAKILNSFELEQNGNQVRITDADGSVYEGQFYFGVTESMERLAEAKADAEDLKKTKLNTAQPAQEVEAGRRGGQILPAAQNVFFRATGTNRNLNQRVVINGSLLAATNSSVMPYNQNLRQSASSAAPKVLPQSIQPGRPLTNQRIQGKAVIGGSNEFQINAVPAPP